ncbi:NAD-glutamate dehydrogenase domain-containing protein [Gordonia sp. (in: high G+C Gram-positive bacteria)]|uniref:NAD-glutamate dehydrogenase domain-containing protein n=1 Tax=Gordonia sp. (in: high G+C Gram-positive bacteria) TaxID=84139 RepID=UPI00261E2CB0|nr:NAD-glutamate dehydrogenase domain-containing protein [Gordonia sp. (in: high G+C Gram-positive bacteria)]
MMIDEGGDRIPGRLVSGALLRYGGVEADRDRLIRHLALAAIREPGRFLVGVTRLDGGVLEIQVVAADAPLLVESVLTVIDGAGLTVAGIDHPIMPVWRDGDGRLAGIGDESAEGGARYDESWISVRAFASVACDPDTIRAAVIDAVGVHAAVTRDGEAIRAALAGLADAPIAPAADRDEYRDLIEWIAGDSNFHLVGYARGDGGAGLGVWAQPQTIRLQPLADPGPRPVIDRVYLETGVLRTRYPLVLRFSDGAVEHQFVGMFTSIGLYQSVREIPVVRTVVRGVLRSLGLEQDSYGGLAVIELLQTYPLVGLFGSTVAETARRVQELLTANLERSSRFFARLCHDGHTVSAIAFLPRDRYSTDVRSAIIEFTERELGGSASEFATRLSDSPLAQLQIMMKTRGPVGGDLGIGTQTHERLDELLRGAVRTWEDDVRALSGASPVVSGLLPGISSSYREERDPARAAFDLPIAAGLAADDVHVVLRSADALPWTFTLYLAGRDAALTDVLPMLASLGLTVLDEHPYRIDRADGLGVRIYEFAVQPASHLTSVGGTGHEERVAEAFGSMWAGRTEIDRLNELVLGAGLTTREVSVLRMYARYLKQCGFPGSIGHFADVLGEDGGGARARGGLCGASCPPAARGGPRPRLVDDAGTRLDDELADVLSLDADRVLSSLARAIRATLRTNWFRGDDAAAAALDAEFAPTVAIKIATRDLPLAPAPRPEFEIFVHSPRVEGVHLRFGGVARGGCRWSDRRDDFRTEILGLVKAQAVKNAVIVPAGAKGGFVVRRPPAPTGDAAADRAAHQAEGVACYRAFVAALIQLTDDLDHETGAVVAPAGVVRRDGDDPYLVMAADKGTASFSDTANAIAAHYGFWLGDAFASGGSVGYDHKAMGITARGAWEAVKRHFREMGIDTQTEEFTAVGVGDMSGDVFGNGMLASECTRLVAAFDHRHIFVDPDPDAAVSYAERARLFALPRSSWADYRAALISAGGGVWSRELKSIPVSPQMRRALGLGDEITELAPPELIRAILRAPVDLLFNGGIGTYIRASDEADSAVGDKANDAVRISADTLRVKVVGEGGNLGVTERGRVEADLSGVRINTDAMDNSAGVDCSDHEVNIKILLDSQISAGVLDPAERTGLLESMTDEVARLVLADNIAQNAELGLARGRAEAETDLHERLLAQLAADGVDLELETLPTPRALRRRRAGELGRGLTSPELATVMAHVKLGAKAELITTTLLDGEVFDELVSAYFPEPLRSRFSDGIGTHRLRREIAATCLVNKIVDDGGMSYLFRMTEATTATVEEAARAYAATAEVFGLGAQIARLRAAGLDAALLDDMTATERTLLNRSSRWFLEHRPQPLAIAAEVRRYRDIGGLTPFIDEWARPTIAGAIDAMAADFVRRGAEPGLARAVARAPYRLHLLDVADLAEIADRDLDEVGDLAFAVLEHFALDELLDAVNDQERVDRWHLLARLALRDDLHSLVRSLTLAILQLSEPGESAETKIADWESSRSTTLARVRATVDGVKSTPEPGIAGLTVAVRALRSLV